MSSKRARKKSRKHCFGFPLQSGDSIYDSGNWLRNPRPDCTGWLACPVCQEVPLPTTYDCILLICRCGRLEAKETVARWKKAEWFFDDGESIIRFIDDKIYDSNDEILEWDREQYVKDAISQAVLRAMLNS